MFQFIFISNCVMYPMLFYTFNKGISVILLISVLALGYRKCQKRLNGILLLLNADEMFV